MKCYYNNERKCTSKKNNLHNFRLIFAMEALNVAMNQARRMGVFEGVKLPNNGPPLSHLFYADDALFVGS